MPYACNARSGEVRLTPSEQRSYQVIGRREQHVFSVCSPTDANRCRNWKIHRFDLDCDGARVPWLDVVEAASRFTKARAWVEAGQMHLEMDPLWSGAGDEPYPEQRDPRSRFDDASPYGSGPSRGRPEVVDLPPGFAPALGLPVQFVDGSGTARGSFDAVEGPPLRAEESTRDPLSADDDPDAPYPERPYAWLGPADRRPSSAGAARPLEPIAKAEAPSAPKKPTEKPAAAPAPAESKASAAAPRTADPVEAKPARKPEEAQPATSTVPQGAVTATIINAPKTSSGPQTSPAGPEGQRETKSETVEEKAAAGAQPGEKTVDRVAAENAQREAMSSVSDSRTAPSTFPLTVLWMGLLAAAGATAALLYSLITRREEGLGLAERDLYNVSLGDVRVGQRDLVARDPTEVAPVSARGSSGLVMPTTIAEALEVIGASADAETNVIKKIVDGLRQSWHPDLARSEGDRAYREQRTAQINVAWDIIAGQQRPAA